VLHIVEEDVLSAKIIITYIEDYVILMLKVAQSKLILKDVKFVKMVTNYKVAYVFQSLLN
jgi:hypothetical protein